MLPASPKVLDWLLLCAALYMLVGTSTLLALQQKAVTAEDAGEPGHGS